MTVLPSLDTPIFAHPYPSRLDTPSEHIESGRTRNVRFGSLAGMTPLNWNICFTPRKTNIRERFRNVRQVPKADIRRETIVTLSTHTTRKPEPDLQFIQVAVASELPS
jgi:hypothetical protein